MKKMIILGILLVLLILVGCVNITNLEAPKETDKKITTIEEDYSKQSEVSTPEEVSKELVPEEPSGITEEVTDEKKCETDPLKIRAVTLKEATNELVSFLKDNVEGTHLTSGDEEGLVFNKDFLDSKDVIYFNIKYTELPTSKSFIIYKAYSKKSLKSKFDATSKFGRDTVMYPGRTEGIFKTEYFYDKNVDGLLDTIQIRSCEGYDVCDYDSELYDETVYTKINDATYGKYWPEMVESYDYSEHASNLVTVSNLLECPFTIKMG